MATEVVMPQMGESIAEGTITKWMKNVGDHVDRDEPLFEISTDKVDAEIPSPAAGTLTEVRFKEGETVDVNTVVAVLDGDAASGNGAAAKPPVEETRPEQTEAGVVATPPAPAPQPKAESTEPPPQRQQPTAPPPRVEVKPIVSPTVESRHEKEDDSETSVADLRRTKSSPLVRKIAEEHGVDIAKLEGTGLSGRVTKNDILSFIESGSASTVTERKAPASAPPSAAPSPEPTPAPVKPLAGDRVEQMSVMRKKIAEHMVLSRRTSAHVTTVYEIDMTKIAKLRDENRSAFSVRTGTKQLKPDEVAGGTFTITNPGVFGGLFGTPIINQPQVAILGVGKIEKRAKVLTSSDGEDYIAIRHMAYFALSFDHRIIDGADAEKFLAHVKAQLEGGQFAI